MEWKPWRALSLSLPQNKQTNNKQPSSIIIENKHFWTLEGTTGIQQIENIYLRKMTELSQEQRDRWYVNLSCKHQLMPYPCPHQSKAWFSSILDAAREWPSIWCEVLWKRLFPRIVLSKTRTTGGKYSGIPTSELSKAANVASKKQPRLQNGNLQNKTAIGTG